MFGRKSSASHYKFTEGCRRALAAARREAQALHHEYVGTEHVLLGLAGAPDTELTNTLAILGVSPAEIPKRVLAMLNAGSARTGSRADLPYTSRAKKSLELAMNTAGELNANYVGTAHLLAGLALEEKGIAAVALRGLGAPSDRILSVLRGEVSNASAVRALVHLDDNADRSIYEQIVAQIQEHVAVGELQPGTRMPTVRQLADELDIAPGTVARAYAELERLRIVVTDGARGTRVADRPRPAMPTSNRPSTLVGLLRPVAVAAFHLGASAVELRTALEAAMHDIFPERDPA